MTEKETLSLDPCIKILESMRPAIWAFHHNQFLSSQRNAPPKNAYKLYQMAQERKSLKEITLSGASQRNFPKYDSAYEKWTS
jgi:hypothetical protein